jgi:hypothetical protein
MGESTSGGSRLGLPSASIRVRPFVQFLRKEGDILSKSFPSPVGYSDLPGLDELQGELS